MKVWEASGEECHEMGTINRPNEGGRWGLAHEARLGAKVLCNVLTWKDMNCEPKFLDVMLLGDRGEKHGVAILTVEVIQFGKRFDRGRTKQYKEFGWLPKEGMKKLP